jgi:hypothetical protein
MSNVSLAMRLAVTTISAIGGDCATAAVDHATAAPIVAAAVEKTTARRLAEATNIGLDRWDFMRSSGHRSKDCA